MSKKKLISVVIPAYNEEEFVDVLYSGITDVIDKIDNYNFEVIIVENGSADNTYNKLLSIHKKDKRFKIVKLTRNCKGDGGISAGLQYVKGDSAIIMYADLEDPPSLIPKFIEKWEQGYKDIYGIVNKRQKGFLMKINAYIFYSLMYWLTKGAIPKNVGDFRLIDKQVYQCFNQLPERNRFSRGLFPWLGFKGIGIKYDRKTTRTPRKMLGQSYLFAVLSLALKGVFSFSHFPLKIASIIGALLSITAFSGVIYFIIQHVIFNNSPFQGFGTIICLILLLFGFLFFLIGILGEYIGLIHNEVRGRPIYILDKLVGIKDKK
ncbi:MAG: glycosyltransferase family 2 protein [Flavobacteriales bacterium]|jgi:polyisoprenyl-phosphate glycosyltransferase|nr:glycosyltransferase family 2 protein [Flavobacteriales bacterium]